MIQNTIDHADTLLADLQNQEPEVVYSSEALGFREKLYLDESWLFTPDGSGQWFPINVPSFWNTPEQFDHADNWKDVTTAWYAYDWHMTGGTDDCSDWYLCFEGVSLVCDVYINGTYAGSHGGRFTPFEFNVTPWLRWGERNTVLLCVGDLSHALDETGEALLYQVGLMKLGDNVPDPFMADHPNFGGIWRPVHLEKRPKIKAEAIRIETSVRKGTIQVECEVASDRDIPVSVRAYVCPWGQDEAELRFVDTAATASGEAPTRVTLTAEWETPRLWSPQTPHLYELRLDVYADGELADKHRVRFGFREFWIEGRHFYLNGSKVRLFGESINMTQQILCSNHRKDYVSLLFRTLKEELNMNCLRLHSMIAPAPMLEAADEVGLLIIDQSGIWSSAGAYYKRGAERFLRNVKEEFREWVWRDINHPSVVVWDVENEMLRGSGSNDWALKLDKFVQAIDPTRPTVHSGAGAMDGLNSFYHIHHNEHYTELLNKWAEKPDKPLVFGEFWVGGRAGTPRNITGFDVKTYEDFAELKAKLYRDIIIEMRVGGAEGVMPYCFLIYAFRPLFSYREQISLSDEGRMEPTPEFAAPYGEHAGISRELVNPGWKPELPPYRLDSAIAGAFRNAFAPEAAFIKERDTYIEAGTLLRKTVTVLNDSPVPQQLTVTWTWTVGSELIAKGEWEGTVDNCGQAELELRLDVPALRSDRAAEINVAVLKLGQTVHRDALQLLIVAREQEAVWTGSSGVIALYDPFRHTAGLLNRLGISFHPITEDDLKQGRVGGRALIIGEAAAGRELVEVSGQLERFVREGGRIWSMRQIGPASWLPAPIPVSSGEAQTPRDFFGIGEQNETTRGLNYTRYAAVYAVDHPIFRRVPNLIAAWKHGDGRIADNVFVKPVASGERRTYNIKVLSGGTRQDHATAIEVPLGKGSYVLTQFHILDNAELDPICRRLLGNLLGYLTEPEPLPVERPLLFVGDAAGSKLGADHAIRLANGGIGLPERGGRLVIGAEQPWTEKLQTELKAWIRDGGTVILLERQPGLLRIFGNSIWVAADGLRNNGIFVRPGHPLTSGLSGTDIEWEKQELPVRYALLLEEGSMDSLAIHGSPIVPLIDLVYKSRKSWWYHAPVASAGYGALEIRVGRGSVVLWQLDILGETAISAHVRRTLLTNLGVSLDLQPQREETVQALWAEDVTIDGNLEEWICDLEDSNVTQWKHAQPIPLPAHSVVKGKVADNMDASGIVYLMYDQNYLYVAGQIIDDVITPRSAEGEPGDGVFVRIGEASFTLTLLPGGKLAVEWDGDDGKEQLTDCLTAWRPARPKDLLANRDTVTIRGGITNPFYSAYAFECAIPWGGLVPLDRTRERHALTIQLIDVDGKRKPEARLAYPAKPLEKAWLRFVPLR